MKLPQLDPLKSRSISGDVQFIETVVRSVIAWFFSHGDALLAVPVIYSKLSRPLFVRGLPVPILRHE